MSNEGISPDQENGAITNKSTVRQPAVYRANDLERESIFDEVGSIDIETTGFDGDRDELIAIGAGYYRPDFGAPEIEIFSRATINNDEIQIVESTFDWLSRRDPDGIVTYNGKDFDIPFLKHRMQALGVDKYPSIPDPHVDLFSQRKVAAEENDLKWPSLEECLEAYDLPVHKVRWRGGPLNGSRFAEDLAPRYLNLLLMEEDTRTIESAIHEYLGSDIEATIALYEADMGRDYTPSYNFP